jgi:TATA-box binding protein (TBP) (component of TFIID and TFIIIB)
MVVITNMTVSFNLNKKIDLSTLENAERRPAKSHFKRLTWCLRGCTALLYASGKVVLVGGSSRSVCEARANYVFRTLNGVGLLNLHVSNIVGAFKYDVQVRLADLYDYLRTLPENGYRYFGGYESERFPGMTYLAVGSHAKMTLFRNGNLIISGCRSEAELVSAFQEMSDLLYNFTN